MKVFENEGKSIGCTRKKEIFKHSNKMAQIIATLKTNRK
jgi:hypothetical protein